MTRTLLAVVLLLGLAPLARAQDMPLSQILIEGEGWKKAENPGARPKLSHTERIAYSPDGSTMLQALPIGNSFLWAAPMRPDGGSGSFAHYAPLRTRRGEKTIEVTGLTTDKDGRIYAATEIGVQVFDPTGRLCGVLTPAAPGKPEHMAFEGDHLTLWIGDTKYTRKLNATGAK